MKLKTITGREVFGKIYNLPYASLEQCDEGDKKYIEVDDMVKRLKKVASMDNLYDLIKELETQK